MKPSLTLGARAARALLAVLALQAIAPAAMAQDAASPAVRRGEPITLNFANADIEAVARTMGVITGRDVVVDPRVKGTITLQTDRPLPPAAAFDQFAAALRLQGFSIVQSDGLFKVLPEADAKLQSGTVTTSVGGAGGVSGSQMITQVFRLNHESANNLLPVLRPLIPPNNTINANPGNNSLVITDYADNMRRLARIIAALDVPSASDIEVIPLRYSIASDMVPLVQRLIDGGGGGGGIAGVAAGGTPTGGAETGFRTALLADPRSNALIVRAATPARLQLIRSLVDKLDRPAADTGNGAAGNIYVVYLKNADAVRLAATLRAAMAAGLANAANGAAGAGAQSVTSTAASPQSAANTLQAGLSSLTSSAASTPVNNANQPSTGGQIQADPSTNSLIITAPEPQYRQLRAVIEKLDSRRAQVLIETLIVEVNADKAAEFGVQWQSALGSNGSSNVGVIGTNSSLAGANIINLAVGLATKSATTLPSTGFNFGIGHKYGDNYVLGFLARFLASNGEGNVLSTPNLLTLDNEEAKIVVGQNVPFVTGQYTNTGSATTQVNPFQTIERKDVGLTLRVRPQISETGTVKMTIFQEVSAVVASSVNNVNGPTTSKRAIESSVLVDQGGIVLLGGLLSDEYSASQEKVPGLGDVPIMGNLFKSETRRRNKTNLMVFLRPTIVRDQLSSDAITADRYDTLRALQQASQPPTDNPMLNNVRDSFVLPPLPAVQGVGDDSRRIDGTRLIPPPLPPAVPGPLSPDALSRAPLKGALPPTDDPASRREMP
ncbi:general secretion pathway protein D [Pseudacidovorax intermedius]|uniref:General secretion pathway protein D n=2 Tax=Pseudacidovorax intermedius TaxID=433924 RepID=A0A370FJT0_9BURK|nr:type II secretion system secretin GspD [Pseudacidovorax intermedius]RDI27008.1 general secretion pathway protein D [Pseudacidovorax intermedius]